MILAGGRSLRMGRDKLPLTVGGVPLIRRVHDALAAHCDEILVVGGEGAPPGLPNTRCVPDLRPGREGPLAGMEAGLEAARHRRVFVAAGDMPFLPGDLVGHLLKRLGEGGARAVVPRHEGLHPVCAAYDRGILPEIRAALDDGVRAVWRFLEGVEGVLYADEGLRDFGDPDIYLMNVNSPEDLERARAHGGGS